tara:strand:- start:66486 stop:66608 length:123 start_codon:yes stop_codon:yes gene_type:complete
MEGSEFEQDINEKKRATPEKVFNFIGKFLNYSKAIYNQLC